MSLKDRFALVGTGCLTFVALFGAMIVFGAKDKPSEERTGASASSFTQVVGSQGTAPIKSEPPSATPGTPALPSFAAARAFCDSLGIAVHDAPLNDGTPRVLGTSNDMNCEIVGNPAVESVGLALSTADSSRRQSAVHAFMQLASWDGGPAWFARGAAIEQQATTVGPVHFKMHRIDSIGILTLDMERPGDRH